VLIIGGGIHGLELAEFLVKRGRAVTIVDELDVSQFGQRMTLTMRSHLMLWFDRKGVRLIGGVREYKEINRRGLVFIDAEGVRRLVEAETIIPALPLKPDRHLYDLLKGKVPEVYCVGDCDGAGTIADAIGLTLRKAIVV
jgi:pyruvate/2-oxoglutarate dehydrogenase complex dihydrolipoamide dehydrogenase (E3) component